jgi:hypothetical protein
MEIIRSILTLYQNTGFFPKAHEILFCTPETQVYEIEPFLIRALYSRKYFKRDKLYVICNFERLTL